MRTRRGVKGLSLVRSFNEGVLRSRTHSEFGTADFVEELTRHSLLMMEEEIAQHIDQRLVDQLIEESRRR